MTPVTPQKQFKISCPFCQGSGRDYDPADPRCPIEGNKMRRVIDCTACEGDGYFSSTSRHFDGMVAYDQAMKKKALKEELRQAALSKLTTEEKEALGLK